MTDPKPQGEACSKGKKAAEQQQSSEVCDKHVGSGEQSSHGCKSEESSNTNNSCEQSSSSGGAVGEEKAARGIANNTHIDDVSAKTALNRLRWTPEEVRRPFVPLVLLFLCFSAVFHQ